jgi:hypothetical protein
MPDVTSQYYPYEHLLEATTTPGLGEIPYMVRTYLMDMPSAGYTPPDDNSYYRCKLMKYLYYDGARPLDNPLPTVKQKLDLVFDPEHPSDPPTDKGYRIFTQSMVAQAQTQGATIMRIYIGNVLPLSPFLTQASVNILFMTNTAYEANTRTVVSARTFEMAHLAQQALSGVNFGAGIGTWYFDRKQHGDCKIIPTNDENMNVGYMLIMGLTFMGNEA